MFVVDIVVDVVVRVDACVFLRDVVLITK